MFARDVNKRELTQLEKTHFVVGRSYENCVHEFEQRTLAAHFGCPNDFSFVRFQDRYYVVQQYYCNVNGTPFVDDVAGEVYGVFHRYVNPTSTVLYSHMLELLLSSIDNPGTILYADPGLNVNYAVYDREHGAFQITDYQAQYISRKTRFAQCATHTRCTTRRSR